MAHNNLLQETHIHDHYLTSVVSFPEGEDSMRFHIPFIQVPFPLSDPPSPAFLPSFLSTIFNFLSDSILKDGVHIKTNIQFSRNAHQPTFLFLTINIPALSQVDIHLCFNNHFQLQRRQLNTQLNRVLRSCIYEHQHIKRPIHPFALFLNGHQRHHSFRRQCRQQQRRQRRIASNKHSRAHPQPRSIFILPWEILSLIPQHITSPKVLLNLSHTCKAFQRLCSDERLWYKMYVSRVSHWSGDAELDHLGQGCNIPKMQIWRQVALDEYLRHPDPEDSSSLAIVKSNGLSPASAQCDWRIELSHSREIRPAHLGPASVTTTATAIIAPSHSSPKLLTEAHMASAQTTMGKPMWRNTGPPVSYTDPSTHFTITAYLQARSTIASTNGEDQTVYQVVLYNLHDHDTPLAIIPGTLWSDNNRTNLQRPTNTRPMIGQLMDIRRYSHQKDILGRTRILFVMAFGERVPANVTLPERAPGDIEMELLDVWTQGKIIEVYIHDSPRLAVLAGPSPEQRPAAPYWGRVQHIDPSPQHPTLIRGRAIKLYSIRENPDGPVQDRVALFGIHHDVRSNIVMLTGPVFPPSVPSSSPFTSPAGCPSSAHPSDAVVPLTIRHVSKKLHTAWSPCFFGSQDVNETTSMTLFPAHSDFENLLVIIDRRGHGEIWDWINNKRVASMTVAQDSRMTSNSDLRRNLYFWGVQVNWTVEEPTRTISSELRGKMMDKDVAVNDRSLFRERGDFRIVALADGQESEWETIRWDIKGDDLRKQQDKISNTNYDNDACLKVESKSRHYETCTMGRTHVSPTTTTTTITNNKSVTDTDDTPMQQSEVHPLLFIAFLIWDHYRIALTSKFGLCVFDMNKEMPEDILSTDPGFQSRLPHWVTGLDNASQNPLLDIATAGDYLILTRRYSHVLWPFRKVLSI
ncbi:hypothetical protein K457DRAFT_131905 [Linnemannia elongata AG-77]|uniref:F-box domain-containing protein n=1 Tax=Linnemannia elongata AG-77 TaxID=1314771 RepID=A0A197KKG3_9FUNG|nr:hypothetical protein K457DRAFT_131905 [Linnemannia elongata AG-77]